MYIYIYIQTYSYISIFVGPPTQVLRRTPGNRAQGPPGAALKFENLSAQNACYVMMLAMAASINWGLFCGCAYSKSPTNK